MPCTHKDSCAMFPVISLSSALKIWQTFYCDGQHETCVRFQRALKGEKVPPNLLPNGKALDLIVDDKAAKPVAAPAVAAAAGHAAPATAATGPAPTKPAPAAAATNTPNASSYSYYLRFRIQDTPGLADRILQEIRNTGIGIDATVAKPGPRAGTRCLIIITDQSPELELFQAILRIEAIEGVLAKVKSIPLEKRDALQAA
jgi:hypothetical protein